MSAVGPKTVRLLASVGLISLFLKTSVIVLGYIGIVHEYIFPVMIKSVPLIAILLMICYLASHGMEKTLCFIVIPFLRYCHLLVGIVGSRVSYLFSALAEAGSKNA